MIEQGQLYELVGFGWRLPIWAKLIDGGSFEVHLSDIPLLRKQREAAEASLRASAHHYDGAVWFLSKQALDQCAFKSSFADPEDVVVWRHDEDDSMPAGDFVRAYCESRAAVPAIRNPAVFEIIWNSICNVMLNFLLVRGGEVDFGFAKLSAVCGRANWKAVILGRIIARRRNGISSDSSEQTRREIRKLLHRDFITACSDGRTVRWTLEVEPKKSFDDAAEVVEIKRKRECRGSYAFNVLKFLKSNTHKAKMQQALESYWRATQIPYAKLPHGFEPRLANEKPLLIQPAPKLSPTPVVDGATMKNKKAFVSLDKADILTVEDIGMLSSGLSKKGSQ
jgi:hypothetical protein